MPVGDRVSTLVACCGQGHSGGLLRTSAKEAQSVTARSKDTDR